MKKKDFQSSPLAMASVAQVVGQYPVDREVMGSIPHKGKCLGCGSVPGGGSYRHIMCAQEATSQFLSHMDVSLSLSPFLSL